MPQKGKKTNCKRTKEKWIEIEILRIVRHIQTKKGKIKVVITFTRLGNSACKHVTFNQSNRIELLSGIKEGLFIERNRLAAQKRRRGNPLKKLERRKIQWFELELSRFEKLTTRKNIQWCFLQKHCVFFRKNCYDLIWLIEDIRHQEITAFPSSVLIFFKLSPSPWSSISIDRFSNSNISFRLPVKSLPY